MASQTNVIEEKERAGELRQAADAARAEAEVEKLVAEDAERNARAVKLVNERLRSEAQRLLDTHRRLSMRLKEAVEKTNRSLEQEEGASLATGRRAGRATT